MATLQLPHERLPSRVDRGCSQVFLNPQQLVVFFHALAAARGAGLEVTRVERDREVGDETVDGFTAAVRHHRAPVRGVGELHGRDRLGEATDLIQLDRYGVRNIFLDAAPDAVDIGDDHGGHAEDAHRERSEGPPRVEMYPPQ